MEERAQPVDVICVCTAEGEIRPLRFRLTDGGQALRVDIDQILQVNRDVHFGSESITFQCGAVLFRQRLSFSLKYCVRAGKWFLSFSL